jgi:fibronectin type 3 domain-containing protein
VKATSVADPTKSASSSITVVAVVLSWAPVSGDVASYRVYRTTQAGGPLTMLSSVSASQLTYSDVNLAPSQTYWYTVTTVSGGGAESSYANQVPASTP